MTVIRDAVYLQSDFDPRHPQKVPSLNMEWKG